MLTNFYPRSPCGERRVVRSKTLRSILISIHALLAESDGSNPASAAAFHAISIHALLAESDGQRNTKHCANRRFLSTLSLRRATVVWSAIPTIVDKFLSTLSLRRATFGARCGAARVADFYPRSPCGERLNKAACCCGLPRISIHALLAESDQDVRHVRLRHHYFYPRSPCGERLAGIFCDAKHSCISIHALLAESDASCQSFWRHARNFYPRSPCGERLTEAQSLAVTTVISIHALLAESDSLTPARISSRLVISIHALLAESDGCKQRFIRRQ